MPAARAGLLGRDVITSINDSPIREQDDLFLNISAALAGSEVKIDVLRNGVPRTFKARLVKAQQGEWVPIVSNRDQPVHGMRVDYASVQGAGAVGVDGVVVTELEPGSPAAKKLLKGMYVVAVNDQPVPTPDDFYRLAKGKGPLTLDVVDVGGETARRKVTLP
jgi:S1-C subfamily serine protease